VERTWCIIYQLTNSGSGSELARGTAACASPAELNGTTTTNTISHASIDRDSYAHDPSRYLDDALVSTIFQEQK